MLRQKGGLILILSLTLAFFLLSSSVVSFIMISNGEAKASSDGDVEGGDGAEEQGGDEQQGGDASQDGEGGDEQQQEVDRQQAGTEEEPIAEDLLQEQAQQEQEASNEICDNLIDDDLDGDVDLADSDCSPTEGQESAATPPTSDSSILPFAPLSEPGTKGLPGASESPRQESATEDDTFHNMGPMPISPPLAAPPPFDPMSPVVPPQNDNIDDPIKLCESEVGRLLLADPKICDSIPGGQGLASPPPVELCNDGTDDDGDGKIDADDPDCQQQQLARTPPPVVTEGEKPPGPTSPPEVVPQGEKPPGPTSPPEVVTEGEKPPVVTEGEKPPVVTEGEKPPVVVPPPQPSECPVRTSPSLNTPVQGEPDPTLPTGCNYSKVEVRATFAAGGGSTHRHLFIIYTDVNGKEYLYRGGPGEPGKLWPPMGSVRATAQEYELTAEGVYDWDPKAGTVTVLQGKAAQDKGDCFASYINPINDAKLDYYPAGPNSNTVVWTLLKKCGVPWDTPAGEFPGWGHSDLLDKLAGVY